MTKVLITGMNGLIGGLLRDRLQRVGGYELAALNRRPVEGVVSFQSDIADLEAIRPAFAGQDEVVHLAAQVADEPFESLVSTNLVGTRNVYEAARLAGVGRVVFANSGATTAPSPEAPASTEAAAAASTASRCSCRRPSTPLSSAATTRCPAFPAAWTVRRIAC